MSPEDKLGVLPFPLWDWAFNGPMWLTLAAAGVMVLSVLLGLAVLVEGRLPDPRHQYSGVLPGDLFLAVGYALLAYGALYRTPAVVHGEWQSWWWQACTLVAAASFPVVMGFLEYKAAFRYRNAATKPPYVYTFKQLNSPTCLGHRVLLFTLAYLLLHLIPAAMWAKGVPGWSTLFGGAFLMAWLFCFGVIDNSVLCTRPRPPLGKVHPLDGGWFTYPALNRWLDELYARRNA